MPLVSIVAVCYNHSRFVEETLDSIKAQTYTNIQLIIMDDCSQDKSAEIIKQWIERNQVDCLFISHEINKGLTKTLNEALEYCKGKYLQLISCDDVLLHDKISIQVEIFEKSAEKLAFIYSDVMLINEESNYLENTYFNKYNITNNPPCGFIYYDLLKKNFIPALSMLINVSVLNKIGRYSEKLFFEDLYFILKASKTHNAIGTTKTTACYRILNNSMSRNRSKKYILSLLHIYHSHISFDKKARSLAMKHISKYSFTAYKNGIKISPYWLFLRLIDKRNIKALIIFICSLIGFKYSYVIKLKNSYTNRLK